MLRPFAILAIVAGSLTSVAAETSRSAPLGTELSTWLYRQANRDLARDTMLSLRDWSLGPIGIAKLSSTAGYDRWSTLNRSRLWVAGGVAAFTEARDDRRVISRELLGGEVGGEPFRGVSFYVRAALDERRAADPLYDGKKWRGLAGDVDAAVVRYRATGLHAAVGRFAEYWGDPQSMIFAGSQPLDGIAYRLTWGRFTLSYRLARLDGDESADSTGMTINRYVAAHRLDWSLSPDVTIGFTEAVVFGGAGRQIELYYLNPILPYHAAQLNEDVNDNTLLAIDVSARPFSGIHLFTQLLIDDFQIDSESAGDREPAQYGFVGRVLWAEVLPRIDIEARYTRVTNWTFNQIEARNRYVSDGNPLGSALGNDYDEVRGRIGRWLSSDLVLDAAVSYRRQGAGRVDAPWTAPWLDPDLTDYSEPFPTGVVETTLRSTIGITGWPTPWLFIAAEGGIERVRNRNNEPVSSISDLVANLSVQLRLERLIDID